MGKSIIHYLLVFLLVAFAGVRCTKQSPENFQSGTQGTVSENNKAGGAKSGNGAEHNGHHFARRHGKCFKPGMPMETSGVFDFPVDSTLPRNIMVVGWLGARPNGFYNMNELFYGSPGDYYNLSRACNLDMYTSDFKYFITGTIYDLHGNLLFQIQDNTWRVYRNAIHKFNYDDNGIEVFDKDGRIAISIDFGERFYSSSFASPTIYVQGIIPCTSTSLEYYVLPEFEPNYFEGVFRLNIPYGTPELNKAFDHLNDSLPIKPMFRYTGKDWQHSRL